MAFVVPVLAAIGGGSATAGGLALASTALTVAGGIKQARAQKKMGKAEYEAATINSSLQRAQADQEDMESREAMRRTRAEGVQFLGRQRAQIAGSGVVSSEGSPLDIIGETAGKLALEQAEAGRVAAQRKAYGYAAADETMRTGVLKRSGYRAAATGTLLGTANNLFSSSVGFGRAGIKGFQWTVPKAKA